MYFLVKVMLGFFLSSLLPQLVAQVATVDDKKDSPDIAPLMDGVLARQRATEDAQQNYLVRQKSSLVHGLRRCDPYPAHFHYEKIGQCLASSWKPIDERDEESEVFWLLGVRVSRLLQVSGFEHYDKRFDHVLPADELRQENARIDKKLAEVASGNTTGERERKTTGSPNEIRLSGILELGQFANPRRSSERGHDTIVADYTGKDCAPICGPFDTVARSLIGTITILEEDLSVVSFHGIFIDAWSVPENGGKITKGSTLTYTSNRLYGGVGFPMTLLLEQSAGQGRSWPTSSAFWEFKDYRKFRATSTILPDFAIVPEPDQSKPNSTPK